MYPSEWNIPSGAIISRLEADLEVLKMLTENNVNGFQETESNYWFSSQEKAIFCLFRHLQDRSQREQLIQHVKNVSKPRIYQVFTGKQFDVKKIFFRSMFSSR